MRFFRRLSRRVGKTNAKLIVFAVCAGLIALLLGAKVVAHKTPLDVKTPSLALQAMKQAKCVGDLWGFDVYLARKNTELLSQPFPKTKIVMTGLFAETILQTAPWERPVEDLKYSFYVLRQERARLLNEATVLLIRFKEAVRDFWIKGEPLESKETTILNNLREEERQKSLEIMEKRFQEVFWKSKSAGLKARMLIRLAALEEQRTGLRAEKKTEQIKIYERKEVLPFYLVLTARELRGRAPLKRELLQAERKRYSTREDKAVLEEYQKALESLSSRDYIGFIEKAEKLAANFAQKDFAPVLLYQAWSVARYDLRDPALGREILSRLKKEYPSSDWAYPEKAPKSLITTETGKEKKVWRRGIGKLLLPFNLFREPFKETAGQVFTKIKEVSKWLMSGGTKELVLDEKSAENYLEPFLPVFTQKNLRGYQINLSEEGAEVFLGVKMGIFDIVFSGRGLLEAEEKEGRRTMRLKLREIKVQGIPVPRAFLRQIEKDFEIACKKEALPMELIEAEYWKGGAKIIFKKTEAPASMGKKEPVSQNDSSEKKTNE